MLTSSLTGSRRHPRPPHGGSGAKGECTVKLNVALVRCGRCGKKYNNPLTHTCVTRMDRRSPSGGTKVKPKLTVKCGNCHRPLGNPLTHRCTTRTDFRKRKAAAEKTLRPAPRGDGHEYADCGDDDCQRFPCRVYKEGRADGKVEGYQIGYAAGYPKGYEDGNAAGYAAGFADGRASCPGPHNG
jgi:hypothetical protein